MVANVLEYLGTANARSQTRSEESPLLALQKTQGAT